ncbi:glyoxalase domain-containing protein 4 [Agrilus planipennis]|uniref:Glyoxalase domain-containing protein 4 n=1 Tax=Agrilus planipennis TaxID=224129 RepID=A0A1W4W8G0_AGRPL|nr:glyoxalase domain-containing protein 4 [Agrilus planipennis]XP_018320344.1 glyoxalase domain-containing protein 4 [Agrilus planipennis]
MLALTGRALHFVFKIPNRRETLRFYRNVLGMKVLRHEEFAEGCEATCNGPYANRWSKTMVGYGPEDSHFVVELTYNYPVKSYEKGNDFIGITIKGKEILERAKAEKWPILEGNTLEAPGGYKFFITDEPQPLDKDPVQKVTLASSNLSNTLKYWHDILGLNVFEKTEKCAVLGFNDTQTKLEFQDIGQTINHAKAYGRIAFSVPYEQQPLIEKAIKESKNKIVTPLISLDTPGKATVRVIILADPDGHEICFVDDEAFKELSKPDYESEKILDLYMRKDATDK